MARTTTTNHALSQATDSAVDTFDFTLDHVNLTNRIDAALAGLAASAAGGNYINSNADNAGKILSAQGGSYRGRVIGVSAADDAHLIFQDNAGTTGTDKYAVGYDDSANALALTYVGGGAALGANGLYIDANANVLTPANSGFGLHGQLLQMFRLSVRNNGGTIEHCFGAAGSVGATPTLAAKITGATGTYTATPQSTSAFANGGVLLTGANEVFIFNVAVPSTTLGIAMASVAYNDSATAIIVRPWIANRTVNGVAQVRLELIFYAPTGGGVVALNTTNIASGKYITVDVLCTLP